MTGEDVKRQVTAALETTTLTDFVEDALAALSPCVVLTREEADPIWAWLAQVTPEQAKALGLVDPTPFLALLSPDEAGDE